jgi:hypothetical protein
VQSTAIAALIVDGKLPKPALAYMTDCGWESEAAWEYVYGETIPRLRAVGVDLQIIKSFDYTDTCRLVDDSGNVAIPAYQARDGQVVKFRTHCNAGWKVNVARRWLREQGVKRCENWIGISRDEARRAHSSPLLWCQNRYPLIELGMSREACLFYLGAAHWPMPPRTSCIICPQRDNESWLMMREKQPRDWARAVAAEELIQQVRPDVFLHSSLVPLSKVVFSGTIKHKRSQREEGVAKI